MTGQALAHRNTADRRGIALEAMSYVAVCGFAVLPQPKGQTEVGG